MHDWLAAAWRFLPRASLPGNYLLAVLGAALQRGTRAELRRAPPFRTHASPGADSQRAGVPHGGLRPHRELARAALGLAPRRSLRGECAELAPTLRSGSTVRTGRVSAAATCPCTLARSQRTRPVLPAYGLQDWPSKNQNPLCGSTASPAPQRTILGENHGSRHFYLAQNRTFLFCVDTPYAAISSWMSFWPGKIVALTRPRKCQRKYSYLQWNDT